MFSEKVKITKIMDNGNLTVQSNGNSNEAYTIHPNRVQSVYP